MRRRNIAFFRHFQTTSAVVIIIPALLLILSCQAPTSVAPSKPVAPPPPAPSIPPVVIPPAATVSPPSPSNWKADGIITPGEYKKSRSYGDFEINWSGDQQNIYIGMKAKTTGWIAVGFGAEGLMKNADIVEGFVTDGKATVLDMFSKGDFGPHPPDIEQGGTNDILESGGSEGDGYTVIEFKRKFDTDDKYDKPLVKGTNKIIWAYATSDAFNLRHSARGSGEIDL